MKPPVPARVAYSTPEEKKAAKAFDKVAGDATTLSVQIQVKEALEETGEGIDGAALSEQIRCMDPSGSGSVDRASFVQWYVRYLSVDGGDEDDEDDDAEERAQEEQKATEAFDSVDTTSSGFVLRKDLEEVVTKTGCTYCEEDHGRKLQKLLNSEGKLGRTEFVAWYLDYVFADDDDDDDDDDDGDEEGGDDKDGSSGGGGKVGVGASGAGASGGFGDMFKPKEGQWKCGACQVMNEKDAAKCVFVKVRIQICRRQRVVLVVLVLVLVGTSVVAASRSDPQQAPPII